MKYIIDVSDNTTWIQVSTDRLEPYTEPDRQAIEDEVWAFAKNIGSFNGLAKRDLDECFGHTTIQGVMTTYDTYREAKAKYEAWKKQKDEVRVGDEVILYDNVKMIVTQVDHETSIQGVDENGECYECIECNVVKKTGRYFDELAELLKKMREG